MPRYRSSIDVSLPAAQAFTFVTDFRNTARWDPRVERAEKLTEGPIGTGTRFRLVSRLLLKEVALPYEITAFDPPSEGPTPSQPATPSEPATPTAPADGSGEATFEGRTFLFRYRDRITVEPAGSGASRLTYDAYLSLRGPFALDNFLLAPFFHKAGEDALKGIARALAREARRQGGSGASPAAPAVTPEEVRRIVAMDDRPVLRNLRITLAYHRLSDRLAGALGAENANWCTYATWASKTAGTFIREEELHEAFRRLLEAKGRVHRHLHALHRALHDLDGDPGASAAPESADGLEPILSAVDAVGRFIREGNRTVFDELGGLFAALLEELASHPEPDPERFERFLERLRPGEARPDRIDTAGTDPVGDTGPEGRGADRLVSRPQGGQDLLRDSMRAYYAARFEADAKRKAELVLLGNALGGLHEQTRLQSHIAGALAAPVAEIVVNRMRDALAQRLGQKILGESPEAQAAIDRFLTPIGEEAEEVARRISTRLLMRLPIPDEVLELGEDVPAPRGAALYPTLLARLDDRVLTGTLERFGAYPTRLAGLPLKDRLRALAALALSRVGLHRPIAAGSAARDWAALPDRMRYIFVYFRSRQGTASLFDPPFDEEQTAAIEAGEVPRGPL